MTLTSGDVVEIDLGPPEGREAGYRHPAVLVTAQRILDSAPSVVHIVPLTSTIRGFDSEVTIERDANNGLAVVSAAQCQHVHAVSPYRVATIRGNVGPAALAPIREGIALILDVPG